MQLQYMQIPHQSSLVMQLSFWNWSKNVAVLNPHKKQQLIPPKVSKRSSGHERRTIVQTKLMTDSQFIITSKSINLKH